MKNIIGKVFSSTRQLVANITRPVRKTKAWRWLRKRVLKSPFRGYFIASWHELKNVTWPDRKTSWKLTFIVIFFTILFAVFTTVLDYGFEKLAKELFLN